MDPDPEKIICDQKPNPVYSKKSNICLFLIIFNVMDSLDPGTLNKKYGLEQPIFDLIF